MALYNEISFDLLGKLVQYQRMVSLNINNQYGKIPSLSISEEVLSIYPDGEIKHQGLPRNSLVEFFIDTDTMFPLLDPDHKDAEIGKITYLEFYAIIYSLYKYLANKRDAAEQP